MNQPEHDNSNAVAPESDEPTKQTNTPLFIIPFVTITDEDKIRTLGEQQSEAVPDGTRKNVFHPPEVKLKARYPGLLRTDSSPSEVKLGRIYTDPGRIKGEGLRFVSNRNWAAKQQSELS